MNFYVPMTNKELSQRKIEEYSKMSEIINWGRKNPVKFAEIFYGLKLIDYQAWAFMQTWDKPFACWVECRGAGKDTKSAVYMQTRMLLIPNYNVYISCNTHGQAVESMKKIEDIALKRIPSFKSATDIFAREVEKNGNSETGFLHNPARHTFRLYNNSQMTSLSNNIEGVRGKRGAVWFNETAWKTSEELAVVENFINVDSSFSTSTEKIVRHDPIQMPLQILYTSSAGDASYPFYEKYKTFAKKMFLGNSNYFVCDIDAYDILHHSTIDGVKIKSHLTSEQIAKAIEEDPDLADRELFNKFRRGSGQNAIVSMDCIIHNSIVRKPELYNITGKNKFLFCYDPARNYDGSILRIFKIINDKDIGYRLECVNVVSMIDPNTKNKTPLPMPQQLEIIKDLMLKYNGERAAEWENIEFYCDSGSGGGGISAICDQLMDDWSDSFGGKHRGIIDPTHKQYETARRKYKNAMPIVHLIDPQGYKKIIYDAFAKMMKLNLITFTSYDNKEYIMVEDKNETWAIVPPDKSICIKYNENFTYVFPPLFTLLASISDINDYKALAKRKSENENYNLMSFKIPIAENDDDHLRLTDPTILPFIQMARNIAPKGFGILPTPMEVTPIQFKSNNAERDKVRDAITQFYGEAAVPEAMMGSSTSGSELKQAIQNDSSEIYRIYRQIEQIVNLKMMILGYVFASYRLKFQMLDITIYNKDEYIAQELKDAQASIPNKSRLCATKGITPDKMFGNAYIENTILKLGSDWTVLQSSYTTTTGTTDDSKIGAPTKDDDISSITEVGKKNDSNDPDNRV